jgi:flagellar hook-associated protein 2
VSSPITFSGFNNIDFNVVLNALMAQASQPLVALQNQQANLKAQSSTYDALDAQLTTLNTAASSLGTTGGSSTVVATSSDSSSVAATASAGAIVGHYDVVVQELARAQVTAAASTAPDANTTVVATGGTLTIGGTAVTIAGPVTLQQLAAQINATTGISVSASVVQSGASSFRLVLMGKSTGQANAFTVTNTLSGGSGVTFTDTDNNGVSGDSPADNAQQATNAQVLVNNVQVVSDTNTLTTAVPGVTLQLFHKDPLDPIGIDVASDGSALKSNLQSFVTSYNAFVTFANAQAAAAANGDQTSIGRDALVRGLRNQLRASLSGAYGSGTFTRLAEIGVEFTQSGTLQINDAVFSAAVANDPDGVQQLLSGTGGAFPSIAQSVSQYVQGTGLISSAQATLSQESSRLDTQIANMQDRLAIQRTALQQQFTAADAAISALQSQTGSISGLSTSLSQNQL